MIEKQEKIHLGQIRESLFFFDIVLNQDSSDDISWHNFSEADNSSILNTFLTDYDKNS